MMYPYSNKHGMRETLKMGIFPAGQLANQPQYGASNLAGYLTSFLSRKAT